MAPSSVAKHRFQNSLDMVAARSMRNGDRTVQSGTGNAWCIVDSPTLGRMSSITRRAEAAQRVDESQVASGSRMDGPANTAPLNIKKIRRRGLSTGIRLTLPPSPRPQVTISVSTPPATALTFTAEWDLTQKTFVFTPLQSSIPISSTSSYFVQSPVPTNVDEEYFLPVSPAPSSPSVYSPSCYSPHHPVLASVQKTWVHENVDTNVASSSRPRAASCASSTGTPVSTIFDRSSLYSHARKGSHSTTASSVADLPETLSSGAVGENDLALHKFKQDLNRSAPSISEDRVEGDDLFKELDRDVLLSPMGTFERMLWDTTETEAQSISRKTPAKLRKPRPDVPRSASSVESMYSNESSFDHPSSAGASLRQQLQRQISKAMFGAMHFRRPA